MFTNMVDFVDGDLITIMDTSDLNLAKQINHLLKIAIFSRSLLILRLL